MSASTPTTQFASAAEGIIEIDDEQPEFGSLDSGYEEEVKSIAASVVAYPFEHGRRYHAYRDGVYILPNDEMEAERLDMTHHMMTLRIGNRLHVAPITNPKRILDVGTGTGIWAIEMGDLYPNAFILGNDLSPIQPRMVPPNVRFEVDDVESKWTHNEPFDFIHCRYMAGAIADWPKLVGQFYEHTTLGGWVEMLDFDLNYFSEDGSLTQDRDVWKWFTALLGACHQIGRDPCPGISLEGWMRNAGFINIHHECLKLPIGIWPKDPNLKKLGAWNLLQLLDGLEAFSLRLCVGVLRWSWEELQVLLAGVRRDLRDPDLHACFTFHVVYGQKPA